LLGIQGNVAPLAAVPSSVVVDSYLAHIVVGIVDTALIVGFVVVHMAADFAAAHTVVVEYTVVGYTALVTDTAADYTAMADIAFAEDIALVASALNGQQLPPADFRNQHRNALPVHSACHNCCKKLALKLLVEQ
jgi:hypothetical protein